MDYKPVTPASAPVGTGVAVKWLVLERTHQPSSPPMVVVGWEKVNTICPEVRCAWWDGTDYRTTVFPSDALTCLPI